MIDEKKLTEELLPILNEQGDSYFAGRIIGTIDNQPKFGEWIIASARLPDDPEGGIPRCRDELEDAYVKDRIKEYIVMIDGASLPTVLFYGGEGRWYDCNGTQEPYRIVAWQPLPEPYKEVMREWEMI